MHRGTQPNRIVITILLLAVLSLVGCRRAGPPADIAPVANPLQLVPEDALFCLRMHHLEKALVDLDQYLMGVAPIMPGMMARMQLGQMLGNEELAGIRMDGDLLLFGQATSINPEDFTLAGLLPITDAARFLEKSPQCRTTDDPEVLELTTERMPPLYLTVHADYVLFCPDREQLQGLRRRLGTLSQDAEGSLAAKISSNPAEDTQSLLWVYGNMPAVNRLYGPWLRDKLTEMKNQIAATLSQQAQIPRGMPTTPEGATLGIEMMGSLLDAGLTQLTALSLRLDADAQTLRISPSIEPHPDTELARAFTGSPDTLDHRLLHFLRPEATMSFWGQPRIGTNRIWWDISSAWLGKILSKEQMEAIQETATEISQTFTGTGVASMEVLPDQRPWFSLRYALPIAGRTAYETLMDRGQHLMNDLGLTEWYERQFGVGMKLSYEKEVAQYQDWTIDAMTLTFTSQDPNSPVKDMIDKMYGDGFEYRFSATEDLMLMAVGPDVDTSIRQMIDQAQSLPSDASAPPEFQAALDSVPNAQQAGFVATYNYIRILSAMPSLVPGMPVVAAQSQSNLVFAGHAQNGIATLDIVVPKQHLMETIQYFMAMQMQVQQQAEQQRQQQEQEQNP